MNIKIENAYVVLDDMSVKKTDLYIIGSEIASIGSMPEGFAVEKLVDGDNKLVIPGLINCHTHSYMSLFRSFADDLSFEQWLFEKLNPIEDRMSMEEAYYCALLSMIEMAKSGTTCFADMHMFEGQTARAAQVSGLRAVISRGLVGSRDEEGCIDEGGIRRLEEAKREMEAFKDEERITFMLAPHAIYTCDKGYIEEVAGLSKSLGVRNNIHLSETRNEVEGCIKQYGKSPVEVFDEAGFFDVPTIAAHCVHLSERDKEILKAKGVSVAANAKSNLKLGNGIADIWDMHNMGINICLGTDSAASNNSLNMFSEMNFTALLHKGKNENPLALNAREVLGFATKNGAKALGLERVGQIKEGFKADLAILDIQNPQFCPKNDLISALIYSANGSEVESVIVNGEMVLEKGKMCHIDEKEIYLRVEEIIAKYS